MYLSSSDLFAMFIAGSAVCFITVMLLIANIHLQQQNRFLKSRLRAWRKACATRHAEIPF
jgi:invasion protein IalB